MRQKGYVLITTSGIMFFIITAITILQLMSAKSLNQQYKVAKSSQDVMNRSSIESIVLMQISNNESIISLPSELAEQYTINFTTNIDDSVMCSILNNENQRITTFNIQVNNHQASQVMLDLSNTIIEDTSIKNILIDSNSSIDLVAIRTVWFPSYDFENVLAYSIDTQTNAYNLTPNISESIEYELPQIISGNQTNLNIIFSTSLVDRQLSIYLRYSDGSVKDINFNI